MSETGNVEIVQAAYAAFGRADVPAILALLADDIDWESYGPRAIPYTGNLRGKAEAVTFFQNLGGTTQFSEFAPEQFVAQGDMVIVLGHERFTVTATGREAAVHWAHAFTLRGGKIVKFREYSETDAIRRAYET
jgi:ketosteroid isomerase-like protein